MARGRESRSGRVRQPNRLGLCLEGVELSGPSSFRRLSGSSVLLEAHIRRAATSRWQTQALDEFNDAARRAARRDGVT
eukprot:scaffold117876_cov56-Phaeocystis_antarctica.AAC.1